MEHVSDRHLLLEYYQSTQTKDTEEDYKSILNSLVFSLQVWDHIENSHKLMNWCNRHHYSQVGTNLQVCQVADLLLSDFLHIQVSLVRDLPCKAASKSNHRAASFSDNKRANQYM